MKTISDRTQRKIHLMMESYELNQLIHDTIVKAGYVFEPKEIELKFEFVRESSPEYSTGKIKCFINITKDL